MSVEHRDFRRIEPGGELDLHVRLAVGICVAQRHDTANARLPLSRYEDVAVRRDPQVAYSTQRVREDRRTEAGRQLESGVIGIALRAAVALSDDVRRHEG